MIALYEDVEIVHDHPHEDPFVEVAQGATADQGQAEPWERRSPFGLAVEVEEKAERCERNPDQKWQTHPRWKVGEEAEGRPRILDVGQIKQPWDHRDHDPLREVSLDEEFHPSVDPSDSHD